MNQSLIARLREFMEDEARSCSMDYGCVTPLYVYVTGGQVPRHVDPRFGRLLKMQTN